MFLIFSSFCLFFFFNDTATTEIYTLSLHDALPISGTPSPAIPAPPGSRNPRRRGLPGGAAAPAVADFPGSAVRPAARPSHPAAAGQAETAGQAVAARPKAGRTARSARPGRPD